MARYTCDGSRSEMTSQLALVDEIWILETIGYETGGHFLFELIDQNNKHLATMSF